MKITKQPKPQIGELWHLKDRPDTIVLITGFTRMVKRKFVKFTILQSGNEEAEVISQYNSWYIPLHSETEKKVKKNT